VRILVTGAQGCIGAWTVKALLDRGLDVMAYDLDPHPRRLGLIAAPEQVARLAVRTGSIEDTAAVKALVKDEGITHIVHLAARLMPFCQANPVAGAMANVIGTLNVFEAARDGGRPVRVVYASSSAVWGPEEFYGSGKLTENEPLKPSTHYGVFKRANEGNARVYFQDHGINSVALRPLTVYGVNRDTGLTSDPTKAMKAAVLGVSFQIRFSGPTDFQYVADTAAAFIACADRAPQGAHVFNLHGETLDTAQIAAAINKQAGAELVSFSGPHIPIAASIDASAIKQVLPDLPSTPLAMGVRETMDRFKALSEAGRLDTSDIDEEIAAMRERNN